MNKGPQLLISIAGWQNPWSSFPGGKFVNLHCCVYILVELGSMYIFWVTSTCQQKRVFTTASVTGQEVGHKFQLHTKRWCNKLIRQELSKILIVVCGNTSSLLKQPDHYLANIYNVNNRKNIVVAVMFIKVSPVICANAARHPVKRTIPNAVYWQCQRIYHHKFNHNCQFEPEINPASWSQ